VDKIKTVYQDISHCVVSSLYAQFKQHHMSKINFKVHLKSLKVASACEMKGTMKLHLCLHYISLNFEIHFL